MSSSTDRLQVVAVDPDLEVGCQLDADVALGSESPGREADEVRPDPDGRVFTVAQLVGQGHARRLAVLDRGARRDGRHVHPAAGGDGHVQRSAPVAGGHRRRMIVDGDEDELKTLVLPGGRRRERVGEGDIDRAR